MFPQSANVYDSLGEAYFNKKEYQVSIDHYKKAISLGGSNGNAEKMIEKIEKEIKFSNQNFTQKIPVKPGF
ncbi:tetratricopeptide repeat protein [Chryseobacterium lactis]|uniref:tetratricopeptide repeat protein n=1 Tax=Chryseobacterium lactis TaxID=1241981 RepID=UPI0021AB45A9|nr:tetratricopeptide repeat protein [Chryseobacterium lactis]